MIERYNRTKTAQSRITFELKIDMMLTIDGDVIHTARVCNVFVHTCLLLYSVLLTRSLHDPAVSMYVCMWIQATHSRPSVIQAHTLTMYVCGWLGCYEYSSEVTVKLLNECVPMECCSTRHRQCVYCIKLNMFEHVSARVVAHDFGAAVFNLFVHE